jgi:hypothetical protein
MPHQTLRFVNAAADAAGVRDADVVVLDTGWTPGPDDAPGPTPIRPALLEVLDTVDAFGDSVAGIDAWAAAGRLADAFAVEGVTWWFHARSFLRLDLQELILWCHVLDRLAPPGRYATVVVPSDRPLLAAAARAGGGAVRIAGGSSFTSSDISGRPPVASLADQRLGARAYRAVRTAGRRVLEGVGLRRIPPRRKAEVLDRIDALAAGRPVLAIVRPGSFHHVAGAGGVRRADPHVAPVLARLADGGIATAAVALSISPRKARDWQAVRNDPALIPGMILRSLLDRETDRRLGREERELDARLRALPATPLLVGARDVGPVLARTARELGPWLARQRRELVGATVLLERLRPAAIVTAWEAARTAWLGAAVAARVPTIAVQHGVIYPDTPDYARPDHPALVRPTLTCVYGEAEREILIRQGAYPGTAVAATGSPRMDPALTALRDGATVLPADERAAVRRELGVADDDRMLVISGGRMTVGDRLGTVPLLARALDGPLPGIHLVVKLHPEEQEGDHYRTMLEGLARAGGRPAPALTLVRDVDLYRLLRAADAHVGVYSTVLTDAVIAGTPNMVVVGQAKGDLLGYVDAGVATPVRCVDDVRAFMADPRPPEPEARRRFLDAHDAPGDAAGRIADLVLELGAKTRGD